MAFVAQGDDLVFEATEGHITLCEEVTRAAGRVEERERSQFVLEGIEALTLLFVLGYGFDGLELLFERI